MLQIVEYFFFAPAPESNQCESGDEDTASILENKKQSTGNKINISS